MFTSTKQLAIAILFGLVAGCARVPPLQEDSIAITEIVQRVKCEIAYAIPEPQPPWPTGAYQWMRSWTAKVDLTLLTNEQSGITPSAIFTEPMRLETIPLVGTFSRSFTLGVGGALNNTATRTEILSFSVSLAELQKWKRRGDCDLPDGLNVYGNLGLKEWIDSALAPVESGQLKVGRHPPPGGKSPPPPPVYPPLEPREAIAPCGPEELDRLKQSGPPLEYYAGIAESEAANAKRDGSRDDIQATYNEAAIVYGAQQAAAAELVKAQAEGGRIIKKCPALKSDVDKTIDGLKATAARSDTAKAQVDKILDALPHDPPIDSISHSVQFIVALSGNVTPSWTLVHFKGPAAIGPLLSGSHSTTHTLNISMGSPSVLPTEQARQLNNLVIIQNIGQPSRIQ